MQVGVGGRDVKKGSSGQLFSSGSFRTSRPLQLECKQPCSCALPFLQTGCLPAAPRTRKYSDGGCPQQMRQAGKAGKLPDICVAGPDLRLFSRSRHWHRGTCLGRALSRALISASVRRRLVASDWHLRIAKGAGTCQLARKNSLSRRMCFAGETEDRFLRVPRPSQGNAAGVFTVRHGL